MSSIVRQDSPSRSSAHRHVASIMKWRPSASQRTVSISCSRNTTHWQKRRCRSLACSPCRRSTCFAGFSKLSPEGPTESRSHREKSAGIRRRSRSVIRHSRRSQRLLLTRVLRLSDVRTLNHIRRLTKRGTKPSLAKPPLTPPLQWEDMRGIFLLQLLRDSRLQA